MPAKKPISEWKHGTRGTYVNGCRCDDCRKANNAYKRALYHRNGELSRAFYRARYRKRIGHRSIGVLDLVARAKAIEHAALAAGDELRQLIHEQHADDVPWIRRDLRIARSFDESRWGGWGEAATLG